MSKKSVYITGASGVLGYEFSHHFGGLEGYDVTGVSRSPLPKGQPVNFRHHQCANVFNPAWLREGDNDATIIHCAGLSNPRTAFAGFGELSQAEIVPHLEMVETMIARGWRGRLIFTSSGGAVYGDPLTMPIREDHPLNPRSMYGLQKVCLENAFAQLASVSGIEVVVLRIANPFGSKVAKPGQGVIPILIDAFREGRHFNIIGDGSALRDYLHIKDLNAALQRSVETDLPEGILRLNIGSGVGLSVNDLIAKIGKIYHQPLSFSHQPSTHDVSSNVLDCKLAEERLGWKAEVTVDQGLVGMLEPA